MIVLYILLGILGSVFLLLLIPLRLEAEYEEGLAMTVGYLFFRFRIFPPKEKKEEKEEGQKKEGQETKLGQIKESLKEQGVSGFLKFIQKLAQIAGGVGKRLFRHLVILRYDLELSVSGSDASDTAIAYGKMCAAVYNASSLFLSSVRSRKRVSVRVYPNFFTEKSTVEFHGVLSVKPLWLLTAGIWALIQFIQFQTGQQKKIIEKTTEEKTLTRKDG